MRYLYDVKVTSSLAELTTAQHPVSSTKAIEIGIL